MRSITPATTTTSILGLWLVLAAAHPNSATAFVAPHRNLSPPAVVLDPPAAFHHTTRGAGSPATTIASSTTARPSSTTALHSNLFDRFFRVARGNLNTALSRFEDPEKVMDQALVDMQNDIAKIRRTYAEVTAGQRRLVSEKNQHEAVADDWYRRAQLALKRGGKESLAREALARREQELEKAVVIQQQLDTQRATLDKLYEGMTALEGKILDAQARKSQLAARAKTAKSTAQVNDMLSGLTSSLTGGSGSGSTSMDAFRRMEDKVVALETQAEISAEMLSNALLAPSADGSKSKSDIEMEFRALEASDSVDRELQKLKKAMLPPATRASYEIEDRMARPASSKRVEVKVLD
eukprot:CAMPEP_0117085846 /NCGR_PEP_ID=MMETSP0472-20121206/60307_1 /TAXON_ID=693140 ORGANISM="Tiarina fusus, Strain LIS" /NCGR_SAMPLE_ID=MMETSP0472 /ASSEMBLY_ACC=CAM_ASM_000603 /LENGTH=351 /DNA_ID=CAMNT_0004815185 /DNA_START=94 /DNA_END=1152 /DNA_ORIENTATION=-